jgi:hypothetical protein
MGAQPMHRMIVALDIVKSTLRTNPVKEALRDRTYLLLAEALHRAGIEDGHLERLTDRGDGVLALIRPADEVPKTVLLESFVPSLSALLAECNVEFAHDPARQLGLRLVIHAGEVHDDGRGFFGEELDVAFRLLDAPSVKRSLKLANAPLVVVISSEIYWSIVQHGYGDLDAALYSRIVRVRVGGRQRAGRIYLPGSAA